MGPAARIDRRGRTKLDTMRPGSERRERRNEERAGPCHGALPGAPHHHPDHRAAAEPLRDPHRDPDEDAGARHAGPKPPEPVPHRLAQRPHHRRLRARQRARDPFGALRRARPHRRSRRSVFSDRRAQGRRGVRVPRAQARVGSIRPHEAQGRLAFDRQLLPRRGLRLGAARLQVARDPPRGHEPGALRLAAVHGGRDHRHARQRVERQRDLRRLLGDKEDAARRRNLQPVRGVWELPLALWGHRTGRRGGVSRPRRAAVAPGRLGGRHRVGRHAGRR